MVPFMVSLVNTFKQESSLILVDLIPYLKYIYIFFDFSVAGLLVIFVENCHFRNSHDIYEKQLVSKVKEELAISLSLVLLVLSSIPKSFLKLLSHFVKIITIMSE